MYLNKDEDEKADPMKYCLKIQKQFDKVPQTQFLKKIEYFVFGALSAYRNHHYVEALKFVRQAPFVCNFGEQALSYDAIVVFDLLKMVEVKLLTKVGRPEHAIITLQSRFHQHKMIEDEQFNKQFPFSAQLQNSQIVSKSLYLNSLWCLYKAIKYELKLVLFVLDHFSQGPPRHARGTGDEGRGIDANRRHVDRSILKFTNKLYQLNYLIEAN